MLKMLAKHKLPSLEAGILLILLVTFIVGAGFFTSGNKITGFAAGNELTGMASGGSEADETGEGIKITGEMMGVTGMERGCFLPNTPIRMADGYTKPISEIQPGDEVLSYDEKSGKAINSTVLKIYAGIDYEYLIINNRIKAALCGYVYAKRGNADG